MPWVGCLVMLLLLPLRLGLDLREGRSSEERWEEEEGMGSEAYWEDSIDLLALGMVPEEE